MLLLSVPKQPLGHVNRYIQERGAMLWWLRRVEPDILVPHRMSRTTCSSLNQDYKRRNLYQANKDNAYRLGMKNNIFTRKLYSFSHTTHNERYSMLEESCETLSTRAVARTFLSKTSSIVHLWPKSLY